MTNPMGNNREGTEPPRKPAPGRLNPSDVALEPDHRVLETLRGPALVVLLTLVALGFVLFFGYAHYNLDQAPHRMYKILGGLAFVTFLFLRPEWTLMLLPFLFPYSELLPVTPIPMVNATNILMSALLISWIGHGVILKRRVLEPSPWNKPLLFFLAWAWFSVLIGVFMHGSGMGQVYAGSQTYWYTIMGFILFFVTFNTVRSMNQVKLLAYLYCVGAGLGAIAVLREYGEYSYAKRVAGGMGDINGAGAYFACALVFTLELLTAKFPLWQRLLLVGSLIGSAVGMIIPASRGAIVAAGVTCTWQGLRGGPIRIMLVVVTGIAFLVFTPAHVKNRFVETQEEVAAGEYSQSSSGRLDIWKAVIEVIQANPIVGVGLGQLPSAMGNTSLGEKRAAHNLYLETAAQMGIPGILLLLLLFWRGLVGARRLQRGSDFPRALGNAYFYFLITLLIANIFGGRLYSIYAAGSLSILTALVFRAQVIVDEEKKRAAQLAAKA